MRTHTKVASVKDTQVIVYQIAGRERIEGLEYLRINWWIENNRIERWFLPMSHSVRLGDVFSGFVYNVDAVCGRVLFVLLWFLGMAAWRELGRVTSCEQVERVSVFEDYC